MTKLKNLKQIPIEFLFSFVMLVGVAVYFKTWVPVYIVLGILVFAVFISICLYSIDKKQSKLVVTYVLPREEVMFQKDSSYDNEDMKETIH